MSPAFRRSVLYFSAFVFPPLALGVVLTFSNLSAIMIQRDPVPLSQAALKDAEKPHLSPVSSRHRAAILLSNEGTQATEVLTATQVLAESGLFDVFTVAPERKISKTTAAFAIYPHYALANAPDAELVVVPAVMDFENATLIDWIKQRASRSRWILFLSEGVRLGAQAGLLDNRKATGHSLSLSDLKTRYPSVQWQEQDTWVRDGTIISSAGVGTTLEAGLAVVAQASDLKTARETAERLGAPASAIEPHARPEDAGQLFKGDFMQLFLRGGFDWFRPQLGVFIYPGVTELGLAGPLDTFPRSLSYYVFTVGAERKIIRTRNGLDLIPLEGIPEMIKAHDLLLPAGDPTEAQAIVASDASAKGLPWRDLRSVKPAQALQASLDQLSQEQGDRIAGFVARMLQIDSGQHSSQTSGTAAWPVRLFIALFGTGFLTLSVAIWGERRVRTARVKQSGSQTHSN